MDARLGAQRCQWLIRIIVGIVVCFVISIMVIANSSSIALAGGPDRCLMKRNHYYCPNPPTPEPTSRPPRFVIPRDPPCLDCQ